MSENVKEIKEIEKQLPTIVYERTIQHDMTSYQTEYYQISDENIERAYNIFKKIKQEAKK